MVSRGMLCVFDRDVDILCGALQGSDEKGSTLTQTLTTDLERLRQRLLYACESSGMTSEVREAAVSHLDRLRVHIASAERNLGGSEGSRAVSTQVAALIRGRCVVCFVHPLPACRELWVQTFMPLLLFFSSVHAFRCESQEPDGPFVFTPFTDASRGNRGE